MWPTTPVEQRENLVFSQLQNKDHYSIHADQTFLSLIGFVENISNIYISE
jgi:hypothetical protein